MGLNHGLYLSSHNLKVSGNVFIDAQGYDFLVYQEPVSSQYANNRDQLLHVLSVQHAGYLVDI